MTETKTVDVTLVDSANYETTLKIDNPKDDLTMTQIRAAFQGMISAGYLLSRYGYAQATVARASLVVTTKTSIE